MNRGGGGGSRAAQRETFRSAVYEENDPFAVARVLMTAATVASSQQAEPAQPSSSSSVAMESSLQDQFGNEWGPVFRSWLDTWEFANAVGILLCSS